MQNIESVTQNQVILVVDDTPANLRLLSDALTSKGFEVAVATSGENAIKQVKYDHPALILLDVQMPGIDGFETCRHLKSDPDTKDIPVIFMTAFSESEDKIKGFGVGAVDYITKPFQNEEVIARVNTHLQIHHLMQELEAKNTLLSQFNEDLEQKVLARTIELQQAQLQVIQQEKLSSLGQMVAGVAHEINNPVNFIYGNISHANQYVEDLFSLIQTWRNSRSELPPEVQQKIAQIDLEFLQSDLPKILSSMYVGAERIREIVSSLRTFSRLDEAEYKTVDIHNGIDSTLMILQHRLREEPNEPLIQIVKKYGDLPLIDCYPGQLNQVFMNLLANSIDALHEQNQGRSLQDIATNPSQITIQTGALAGDRAYIKISDNGAGIPEELHGKIFDPFFTSKPVGKGTGLGLSISHQIIVERHGGKIEFSSEKGQGTEFLIEIPISQGLDPSSSTTKSQKAQVCV
jgi:two-component system, NtrC family, sensor kinase